MNSALCIFISCTLLFAWKADAAIFSIPDGDVNALKAAINTSNTNGEDDVIELANQGNYVLAAADNSFNGLPVVTSDGGRQLVIHGNNATIARTTAQGTDDFRILEIGNNAIVAIDSLTMTNGLAEGGAIINAGELTLDNCRLSGNSSGDTTGGAIENFGQALVIKRCVFSDNLGAGGGIYSEGMAIISDSLFQNNQGYDGGAIYLNAFTSDAALIIHNCTFSDNSATSDIGGGAIYAEAYHHNLSMQIDGSTFHRNSGYNYGGAIYVASTNFSTVTAALTNCTFMGNSAPNGGAIYNYSKGDGDAFSAVSINHTTFSDNSATSGGVVYNDSRVDYGNYVRMGNTILRAGLSGGTLYGQVTSVGNNLCSDSGGGQLTGAGDQINTDPKLDPNGLQDNGGLTQTIALLPDSPAINAGNDANAPHRDQRGYFRNGRTDIGAFEYNGGLVGSTSITRNGNDAVVSAEVVQGKTYRLERKLELTDANWHSIPGLSNFVATGNDTESVTDPNAISLGKAFYHITLVP